MDEIVSVFTAASSSQGLPAMQTRMKKALRSLSDADFASVLRSCCDRTLIATTKDDAAAKVIRVFCCEAVLVEDNEPTDRCILTLRHMLARSRSIDKTVRYRSCEWVHAIFSALEGLEVDGAICDEAVAALQLRLRDKITQVRIWAIRAASMVMVFDESGSSQRELLRLMGSDASREVRAAAVASIVLDNAATLPAVAERTNDVSPEVRSAVYGLLGAKIKITHLKRETRALLVRRGLADSDAGVRSAAAAMITAFLHKLDNCVPSLMQHVGLETHEAEAALLARCLLARADGADDGADDGAEDGLKTSLWLPSIDWSAPISSMSAADVLWTVIRCEHASRNYAAATSADVLDSLLPAPHTLGSLLEAALHPTYAAASGANQTLARHLLRLPVMLSPEVDAAGCDDIQRILSLAVVDTRTPSSIVEAALDAWAACMRVSEEDLFGAVAALAWRLMNPLTADESMAESIEAEVEADKREAALLRVMELYTWVLQRGRGGRDIGIVNFRNIINIVLECLVQPVIALRVLAVRCLGLLSISSAEVCAAHRDILLQVLATDAEMIEIRSQAMLALLDISIVHCERYKNDRGVAAVLRSVLASRAEPVLVALAAEGAAKLMFAGSVSEPSVLASLIKTHVGGWDAEDQTVSNEAEWQKIWPIAFCRDKLVSGLADGTIRLAAE